MPQRLIDAGVVIVTHEPRPVLVDVLDHLFAGTAVPAEVVVLDSGSSCDDALARVRRAHPCVRIIREQENVGFCVANNRGLAALEPHRFTVFLNPDALVSETFLERVTAYADAHPGVGAVNPKLLKVDPTTLQPTGTIDCAGIFQRPWGRVYDRGQGEVDTGQYDGPPEDVPALCAAAMVCRRDALAVIAPDGRVFDESFFMFKEDVDLSYRLRAAGWRTVLLSDTVVWHCRGYEQKVRATIPDWVRRLSLRNEWKLWRKPSLPTRLRVPMFGYLLLKSVAVRLGR